MSNPPPLEIDMAEIAPGQLLAGKYLVERVLGRGGMGVVVAAVHQRLNERVAIKVLASDSADAIGRFEREARVVARIRSEYVARVMDIGELDSGASYIVMEYLEGEDLAARLQRQGPFAIEEAVTFVLQACVALADAHLLGVVHRDLKPANLFCMQRSDGQLLIKVLDFGVSKLVDEAKGIDLEGSPSTETMMVMGTPRYMSPEQLRSSKSVDVRSDIWALGVVLFELITGQPPFPGQSFGEVAVKIAADPPHQMASYRADVPRGLESVVRRCLEKDREQRFANVAELARALLPFAAKEGAALVERISAVFRSAGANEASRVSRESVPGGADLEALNEPSHATRVVITPAQAPGTMTPWASLQGQTERSGAKRLIIGVSAAVALVVLIGFGLSRRSSDRAAETANVAASGASAAAATEASLAVPSAAVAREPGPVRDTSTFDAGALRNSARPDARAANSADTPGIVVVPVPSTHLAAPAPTSKPPARGARADSVAASPSQDCNPPYTLDERGRKHFKRQCFQNNIP